MTASVSSPLPPCLVVLGLPPQGARLIPGPLQPVSCCPAFPWGLGTVRFCPCSPHWSPCTHTHTHTHSLTHSLTHSRACVATAVFSPESLLIQLAAWTSPRESDPGPLPVGGAPQACRECLCFARRLPLRPLRPSCPGLSPAGHRGHSRQACPSSPLRHLP